MFSIKQVANFYRKLRGTRGKLVAVSIDSVENSEGGHDLPLPPYPVDGAMVGVLINAARPVQDDNGAVIIPTNKIGYYDPLNTRFLNILLPGDNGGAYERVFAASAITGGEHPYTFVGYLVP
jgi:hypothetical protein